MSQEKPQFKVTDRRLFNPDGTPRDIERAADATADDSRAPAATGSETAAAGRPAADASAAADSTTPQPAGDTARGANSPTTPAAAAASEPPPSAPPAAAAAATVAPHDDAAADAAGAEDPTAFANLVMFIASPAAASMGMTEHPGLAPGELDLPLAKHCIDLLGTLQQKALGNLGSQEAQILEGLLAELRMQYISLTSTRRPTGAATAPPPGFSGSDITGGR